MSFFNWTTLTLASDQSVTNSATYTDVTGLSFSMAASTKYMVRGEVFFDTTAAGDYKYKLSCPASLALVRITRLTVVGAGGAPIYALTVDNSNPPQDGLLTGTGTTGGYFLVTLIVHTGASSGTFKLQFAQNTQTAAESAVTLAGSRLEYLDTSSPAASGPPMRIGGFIG